MAPPARPKTERRKTSTASPVPRAAASDRGPVSDHDIALRAFAYYCERGCEHGADVEDWLRAERDLRGAPKTARRRAQR